MSDDVKTLTILGATGSIGDSTLDLVRRNPDRFRIRCLTANTHVEKLASLAREFRPDFVAVADEGQHQALKQALADTDIEVGCGESAIVEASDRSSDMVMAAIVGAAGLTPALAAIKRGATLLLANKECLVCAGSLVTNAAKASGATLLPVDSEHNAIFQVFEAERAPSVSRLILTASGGPFRGRSRKDLESVTPKQAVNHPNWSMGAKISVDSATLMNKGLEVIEAFHLYPVRAEQIEVIVHPQSVIHSMVEYIDGSILAQLGSADMRVPIAYCLAWPDRIETPAEKLDFAKVSRLDFEAPDLETFVCLRHALDALKAGGTAPLVLNAANEVAVAAFLAGKISFLDIAAIVGECLESVADTKTPHCVATVLNEDSRARHAAYAEVSRRTG